MKIVITFFLLLLVSGCAIQPNTGQAIEYRGEQILSEQDAKNLPRETRISSISANMKSVGFTSVKVSYLLDAYSDTVLNIYSNQFELMKEYKSLLDNHKDVTSFLMANQGKSEQEIKLAADEFDATAKDETEKVGPKLNEYKQASDKIWQENAKLTAQIAAQALELGAVLYSLRHQDKKAKEEKQKNSNTLQNFIAADFVNMLSSANRTYEAYKLAEIRLHLAKIANDFIKDEQAIIDISKQLQEYQNAQ